MSDVLANLAVAAGVGYAGVALLLCIVGTASYVRLRSARLLWVSIALGVMAVQGAVLARQAYADRAAIAAGEAGFPFATLLGLGAAAAMYLAVLKR